MTFDKSTRVISVTITESNYLTIDNNISFTVNVKSEDGSKYIALITKTIYVEYEEMPYKVLLDQDPIVLNREEKVTAPITGTVYK